MYNFFNRAGGEGHRPANVTAERLRELANANRARGIVPVRIARRDVAVPEADARGAPQAVIRQGAADNMGVFQAMVANAGLMKCMLRMCNVAPFVDDAMQNNRLGIMEVTLAAALCTIRAGMVEGGDGRVGALARQQLIAEVLAPNWPEANCLNQADSVAELERILANPANFARQAWFLDIVNQLPAGGDGPNANNVIENVYNRATNAWVGEPDLVQKLAFIRTIATHANSRVMSRTPHVVLLLLVAFATRGQLSTQRLQRIKDELRPVMPILADMLDAADIATTFANFGECIDDTNAHVIFSRWLRHVPRAAIRLRVLLSQAAGSGVTSLDIIAEAVATHADFPWHLIQRKYPEEWAAVSRGLEAVGGRIYAGYAGNLGAVRATLFRHITWVAKEILVSHGNTSLANYRGGAVDSAFEKTLKEWIATHTEVSGGDPAHMEAERTDDEARCLSDLLVLAQAHPNVAYHLANLDGHGAARVEPAAEGAED